MTSPPTDLPVTPHSQSTSHDLHDVTPQLISQISSQLLRNAQAHPGGRPGAGPEPWPSSNHSTVPPTNHPTNGASGPSSNQPQSQQGSYQSSTYPGHSTSYGSASPEAAVPHAGGTQFPYATPGFGGSSRGETDGLRAFVQRVMSSDYRSHDALCPDSRNRGSAARTAPVPTFASHRPLDPNAVRRDFPALNQLIHGRPLVWLDNAATTHKPQSVIDAISHYYAHDNSNIHRGAHTLAARSTDAYEQSREKVQKFLGAGSKDEIIYVRGTTEGINLIAKTWGQKFLQPGDEIVLSTLEHHANIVPWQMIAREKGAHIKVIPVNDNGEIIMRDYHSLLGPRTKLVALAHASNSLGTILPVAEMTNIAKRYGAHVLIDGAQTVSHVPVNVQQLDCDFYVFSGHKIFGPTGIGAVYGRQELLELMPPWQGGGNMIRTVTFEETTYADVPAKFEAGTPNIADAIGLGAALDYVNTFGLSNISAYEHKLLEYATEQLSRINGLRLIGTAREKVGVLSFVLKDRRVEEVGRMLDLEGIAVRAGHHCAQPSLRRFGVEATIRPSLAFYNTPEDIDRLVAALRRIQVR